MSKFSILQNEKKSYFSGKTDNLEKHHIYFGNPLRKLSDKYGCWVWLTSDEHRGNKGPHHDRNTDLLLKRACQEEFEMLYGNEKFMAVFGRSYLE